MKAKTFYGVYTKSGVCCLVAESKAEALAYFPFAECDEDHIVKQISESAARSGCDL